MSLQNSLFQELQTRKIIYQVTDPALENHLEQKSIRLYCGFDPSADSLHVGSLFPLMTLRRFQLAGHKPILILGGATGMIGDPSFKAQERNLLTLDQIEKNLEGIRKNMESLLDFNPENPNCAVILNNFDFYKDMNVLQFLRDVGKFFTVNHMVGKESVRARMDDRDQGISYTEFSYMLLQGYDFYHLYKNHQCTLQIGASDQWGNITAGTELIRKKLAHAAGVSDSDSTDKPSPAFGLTHPLINRSDGQKFGKSEKGAIWLSAERTSPYQFYQFFVQAPDDQVIEWINYLTFIPLEEIKVLEEKVRAEPEKKAAQIALAKNLTSLVHGEAALQKAEKATQALFGTEIQDLDLQTLNEIFSGAPSTEKNLTELEAGIGLIDLLVETTLFQSKGAARKEIPAGGVYLNNQRVTDVGLMIKKENLIAGTALVLRKGKKNYHFVKFKSR